MKLENLDGFSFISDYVNIIGEEKKILTTKIKKL